jgi:SAM-dependent methyltransferase
VNERERVEKYFDRVAGSFDAIYSGRKPGPFRLWDRITRRNIYDRLEFSLAALSPLAGRRVLDVGCGSGRYGIALAERGASEVMGIDVSAGMLRLARALTAEHGVGGRCRFGQHDVRDLPPTRAFDDAVAMGFFDYVREPLPAMQRLSEVVRERLVASFPARSAARVPFRRLWLGLRGCPVRFYSRREIASLCDRAGFDVVELVRRGPIYLLVARARPGSGAAC